MDVMKKFFVLLAIFCVIGSAAAVCAADVSDDFDSQALGQSDDFDGGWAGSQYEDGGWAGSQYQDDGGWAGSQYNETLENATANATNTTNITNDTANTTAPVVANQTNATAPHTMLATGNPILALFAVSAVLGGYSVLRRKD